MKTFRIDIEGLVQGVGFRPFVYKLASSMGLEGTVENLNTGVRIFINSENGSYGKFVERVRSEAPLQSVVESLVCREVPTRIFTRFSIITSSSFSEEVTRISPDIAVCDECLTDMAVQEHRRGYPLVNCTNCGPRFSIIKSIPYDRPRTTMAEFELCPVCCAEYNDVNDRRFHAQPVACNNCGPVYRMVAKGTEINSTDAIVKETARCIDEGGIIALKGTGGYHLVCDAMNEDAVASLRLVKGREGKPFAVMCRDTDIVREIATADTKEMEALQSWQRPVMLLEQRGTLAPSVSNGLATVGAILPYMPFHYLLFRQLLARVIVFTSANMAEEPVITDDRTAETELGKIARMVISYNREIYNRTDDSVVRYIAGDVRLVRRSRGYAPTPVRLGFDAEGIFGAGAELANCFGIGKGKSLIMSQHIGDLRNGPTLDFYETAYSRFASMFRFNPTLIARDIHPDYLSSVFAGRLSRDAGVPTTVVQHHHAHIASCMAENGLTGKVIGVAMDGVGLGTDGQIWGGEFLIAGPAGFDRVLHFEYVPMAGGDHVSHEPWRSGVSFLISYLGQEALSDSMPVVRHAGEERVANYIEVLKKGINTANYSSAGRLFDAVAAITGLDSVSTFHAEAPMRLESSVKKGMTSHYDFEISGAIISFGNTIKGIVADQVRGMEAGEISAKFHNTVGRAMVQGVRYAAELSGLRDVALSGGTFQNRYLTELVVRELLSQGFNVYFHRNVPANDGGLALGQVAVAAARREAGII
jgi:hydrogenase maturation protein HypF